MGKMGKKSSAQITSEPVIRESEPAAFREKKKVPDPLHWKGDINWSQTGGKEQNPLGAASSGSSSAGDLAKSPTRQPQIRNKIKVLTNPSFGGTGSAPRRHSSTRTPAGPSWDTGSQPTSSSPSLSSSGTVCAALQREKSPTRSASCF